MSSVGNTNRDVRKFLREIGMKPTAENVDKMAREVRRTESQHERVQAQARERGESELRDAHGSVRPRVRSIVQRDLDNRRR